MHAAMRMQTKILPGHRIDISTPGLPEGSAAEVIVFLPGERADAQESIIDFLDSLPPGPRLFKSAQEVDEYITRERDAWGR